jgi:anti-sigma regulatory factor (Ser/Thr protein kinase)
MSADSIKSLIIDSRLAEVRRVGAMVREACLDYGLKHELAGAIELAVVEAANNIIKHAYGGEPGHRVELELKRKPGRLVISISDWGKAISNDIPSPPPAPRFDPHDPVGLQEGGMGLFIISQVMDQAERHQDGGRNTLIMSKKVPGL